MRHLGTLRVEQDSFIKSFWVWCENEARNKPRGVCAGPVKWDPVVDKSWTRDSKTFRDTRNICLNSVSCPPSIIDFIGETLGLFIPDREFLSVKNGPISRRSSFLVALESILFIEPPRVSITDIAKNSLNRVALSACGRRAMSAMTMLGGMQKIRTCNFKDRTLHFFFSIRDP